MTEGFRMPFGGSARSIAIQVVAGLILLTLTSVGSYLFGEYMTERRYAQHYEAAPTVYWAELSKLIMAAAASLDEPPELISRARAVVSTRNELRRRLATLSELLNSDIDRLGAELEALDKYGGTPPLDDLVEAVRVLAQKWPAKGMQIEIELRKLIAEMGIVEQEQQ